jgi:hypothetical protein
MKRLKTVIRDIPFIILFLNGFLLIYTQFWQHDWVYWLMPQLSGHGLLLVLFMAFYAYVHRYCLYSWVCIGGLGMLNILNIIYFFVSFNYYQLYAGFIILPCIIFTIIKWKQAQYYKQY